MFASATSSTSHLILTTSLLLILHLSDRHSTTSEAASSSASSLPPSLSSSSSSSSSSTAASNQRHQAQPHQLFKHHVHQKMIAENPGSLIAVARALKMAKTECQHQTRHDPWNCPVFDLSVKPTQMFGKLMTRSVRETSFVNSLMTAALAHATTRACTNAVISTCGPMLSREDGYKENVEFGAKFARMFMDATHELAAAPQMNNNINDTNSRRREHKTKNYINAHNDNAGILYVINSMKRECKCHGLSGTCNIYTCWLRLSPFREVATKIRASLDGAIKFVNTNQQPSQHPSKRFSSASSTAVATSSSSASPSSSSSSSRTDLSVKKRPIARSIGMEFSARQPNKDELLYLENSPDFCEANEAYSIQGTKGRLCSEDKTEANSCERLCCGRGHRTEIRDEKYKCECEFKWCCNLNCKTCTRRKVLHKCL